MTYEQTLHAWRWQREQEERRLRRNAWFVGVCLVAVEGMKWIASFLLGGVLTDAEHGMGASVTADIWFYTLYALYYVLVTAAPVAVAAALFRMSPLPEKPLRHRISVTDTLLILLFGLSFCMLANYLTNYWLELVELFGVQRYEPEYMNDPGIGAAIGNLAIYAVIPGILEELVFRGWILGALRPFGERRALLLSALLFGLLHGNLTQIPFAFLLGLLFGFLCIKTGSLWPSMLLHVINNGLSVVMDSVTIGMTESESYAVQIAVLTGLAVIGAVAGVILYSRPAAAQVFSPLIDRRRVTPGAVRSRIMWLSPAVITAILVMVVMTLAQEVMW